MNIDKLREHLFATIDGLRNDTMDVEKAKAIGDIAQTVINSAKVEVDYLRAVDGGSSRFLGSQEERESELPAGIVGIRQHRIAG